MKKLLPVLCCFIFLQSKADTVDVQVSDFQFNPKTLNVSVGDVVRFVWLDGEHTTTSSGVPVGAAAWDSPMNLSNDTFNYAVTTPGSYTFFCKIHGAAVMSGSFVASGPLPVTLSAFSISSQNNKPLLSWTTQTEMNIDYFSIRKSSNGVDFKEVGKITATGNSTIKKNYSFSDEIIAPEINYLYYALGTVDKDGRTQLSPIKIYKNKNALPKLIISLSPNPVSGMGHLMLRFNADKKGIMVAKLADMQGKVVLKTELSAEQGINNGHIHLGNVPSGIYTIYFSLDGISESYRVVKN